MRGKSLLITFLLVLASMQAEFHTVHAQQEQGQGGACRFRYEVEPGPTMETCNIIGTNAFVTCQVSGSEQLSVQWHFTKNINEIGNVNMNLINATIPRYSFESSFRLVDSFYLYTWTFKLFISKVDSESIGYYWCSIKVNTGQVQPNPSTVLHVAKQCSIQDVSTCPNFEIALQQNVAGMRCANVAPNISVVAAQNINNCMPSTPTTMTTAVSTDKITTKPVPPVSTTQEIPKATTSEQEISTTNEKITTGRASTTLSPNDKPTTPRLTKPTTGPVTKPKDIEHMTTLAEIVTTITQETDVQSFSKSGTGVPQGDSGIPLDVIWLGIGIILAVLLTAVMVLLVIIACLQFKKRRVKRLTAPTPDLHAYSEGPEAGAVELTRPSIDSGKEKEAKSETENEPEYEEIPANRLQLGPTRVTSPRSEPQTPGEDNTDSLQYEDVSIPAVRRSSSSYEIVEDPPEYSRLEHSGSLKCRDRPSTSSVPSMQFPPRGRISSAGGWSGSYPPVFDDPKYVLVNDPPHVKVMKSKSENTNTSEEYSQLDLELAPKVDILGRIATQSSSSASDNYHQQVSAFVGQVPASSDRRVLRTKSHDTTKTHEYTPIIPNRPRRKSEYTFPIVSTEDKYISEQGHMYHVLEAANAKKKESNSQNTSKDDPPQRLQSSSADPEHGSVVRVDSGSAHTKAEVIEGAVYQVLEEVIESEKEIKSVSTTESTFKSLSQSEP